MAWNQRFVSKPPEITCIFTKDELDRATEMASLVCSDPTKLNLLPERCLEHVRKTLIHVKTELLKVEDLLTQEGRYLSAYIYQNGRHRTEKFMQALKKVKKCLRRLDEIDLCKMIDNIVEMFPITCYGSPKIRLPSNRNFHFLLSSFVGLFRLLLKISSYSLESAAYLRAKMLTGHFFAVASVFLAFVARIRVLALDQAKIISEGYDSASPFLICMLKVKKFQEVGSLPNRLQHESKEMETSEYKRGDNKQRDISRFSSNVLLKESTSESGSLNVNERPSNSSQKSLSSISSTGVAIPNSKTTKDILESPLIRANNAKEEDIGEQVSYQPNCDVTYRTVNDNKFPREKNASTPGTKLFKRRNRELNLLLRPLKSLKALNDFVKNIITLLSNDSEVSFCPEINLKQSATLWKHYILLKRQVSEEELGVKMKLLKSWIRLQLLVPRLKGKLSLWRKDESLMKMLDSLFNFEQLNLLEIHTLEKGSPPSPPSKTESKHRIRRIEKNQPQIGNKKKSGKNRTSCKRKKS